MKEPSRDELKSLVTARIEYLDFATSESDELKVFHVPVEMVRTGRWADPELPLLYRFGMPQDLELALRNMSGSRFGDKYKNFTVEFFGVLGEIPEDIEIQFLERRRHVQARTWHSYILDLSDIPEGEVRAGGYMIVPLDSGEPMPMQVWRTRVFMEGTNMYIEELWHARQRIWFRRIENIPVVPDQHAVASLVKKLADGLGLPAFISEQKTRGDELSEQDFKEQGLAALKKLPGRSQKLSDRALAKALGLHRTTVSKYRTKYPGVWALLVQEFQKRKV